MGAVGRLPVLSTADARRAPWPQPGVGARSAHSDVSGTRARALTWWLPGYRSPWRPAGALRALAGALRALAGWLRALAGWLRGLPPWVSRRRLLVPPAPVFPVARPASAIQRIPPGWSSCGAFGKKDRRSHARHRRPTAGRARYRSCAVHSGRTATRSRVLPSRLPKLEGARGQWTARTRCPLTGRAAHRSRSCSRSSPRARRYPRCWPFVLQTRGGV